MLTFSNFQCMPNCQKLWHLKNGLFAMKCIIMCSDMNIWHFKHRFIYTNNISLIQIWFKVNMRFFFLSVYIPAMFIASLYLIRIRRAYFHAESSLIHGYSYCYVLFINTMVINIFIINDWSNYRPRTDKYVQLDRTFYDTYMYDHNVSNFYRKFTMVIQRLIIYKNNVQ